MLAAYYNIKLLQEDSPLGQEARSLLGLDKHPGSAILKNPRIANYKANPRFGGYQNKSKGLIELFNRINDTDLRDKFKEVERREAEKYFGKAQAGFLYNSLAVEEERIEPWASRISR